MRPFLILLASAALAQDIHISPDALRGDLSFLASDLLEGRATPSRGLDLAAEFIASQFRKIGLEPIGDDGYFQTATVVLREQNSQGFEFSVTTGGKTVHINPGDTSILTDKPLRLENVPIAITPEDPAGKVVVTTGGRANVTGAALVLYSVLGVHPMVVDPDPAFRSPPRTVASR